MVNQPSRLHPLLGGKSVSLMVPLLIYYETVTNLHISTCYYTGHQGWVHFLSQREILHC